MYLPLEEYVGLEFYEKLNRFYNDYTLSNPFRHPDIAIGKSEGTYPIIRDWIPSDSLEEFYKNLRKDPDNKSLKWYLKHPIQYKINSMGLRGPELEQFSDELDLYLGCSVTFGIGNHENHTWVHKMGKCIGFPYLNGGLPGLGIMSWFRLFMYVLSKKKIRNLFILGTYMQARTELFNGSIFENFNIQEEKKVSRELTQYIFNDTHLSTIHLVYFNAIQSICKEKSINLYILDRTEIDINNEPKIKSELDFLEARDLGHLSVKANKLIFEKFMELVGPIGNISYI